MRYLASILRIFVLVAVVLGVASFSDVNKAKAATTPCGTNSFWDPNDGGVWHIRDSGTLMPTGAINATFRSDDGSCNTNINRPDMSSPNLTVSIENGVTVTTSGTINLPFAVLIVTDNAKITQDAINVGDIEPDGITLKDTAKLKKVDLNVADIRLTNHGRIDVSAKGYPGGNEAHPKGYGLGGGTPGGGLYTISGGGYGGRSCLNYTGFGCSSWGGSAYGSADEPFDYGSGGGYNSSRDWVKDGAPGGGIIKINAGVMTLDYNSQTFISANGGGNDTYNGSTKYGGGAGGSIWINVDSILTTLYDPSFGEPSAAGNQISNAPWGENGTVRNNASEKIGEYIVSKGGELGGGGGRIKISIGSPAQSCHVTGGDVIPAYCETKDVTVSDTTVYLNRVLMKPARPGPNFDKCSLDDADCDSKRHFASLTVESDGLITYDALVEDDIFLNGTPTTDPLGIVHTNYIDLNATGKTKKIDLILSTDLNLINGGSIRADGKGYPGGIYRQSPDYMIRTFGPGAGQSYQGGGDHNAGSGASFMGTGGKGIFDLVAGVPYPGNYGDGPTDYIANGSGGGGAHTDNDNCEQRGGAGGGRIKIQANQFNFKNPNSVITANGEVGKEISSGGCEASGGGGSGGTVWLQVSNQILYDTGTADVGEGANQSANVYVNDTSPFGPYTATGKYGRYPDPVPPGTEYDAVKGRIDITVPDKIKMKGILINSSLYNIHAMGSNASRQTTGHVLEGGVGGGGHIIIGNPIIAGGGQSIKSRKVEVIVTWSERGIDKYIKLYTVLRNLVTTP